MYIQGSDNTKDREIGAYWERRFCLWAAKFGNSFTPMQLGRQSSAQAFVYHEKFNSYTLPDVTIWSKPGEHHEIKHKSPTRYNTFGLEKYRLDALLWFANETGQSVMYTIHNHLLSGGRDSKLDSIHHWFTANILDLHGRHVYYNDGNSYINGKYYNNIGIFYWSIELWIPLLAYWSKETSNEITSF